MLRWALYILATLVALIVIMAVIGFFLPKGHHATRRATFTAAPPVVFAAISDFARFPEWRSTVKSVEILPEAGGKQMFKEVGKSDAITYRVEERAPNTRLVTRIADESLAFGGSWTFELQPVATGTELTITEDGEVYNPIFRFLSRTVFSPTATMETYSPIWGDVWVRDAIEMSAGLTQDQLDEYVKCGSPEARDIPSTTERYLIPTTIESGPTSGSTRLAENPASFIQPAQSTPV